MAQFFFLSHLLLLSLLLVAKSSFSWSSSNLLSRTHTITIYEMRDAREMEMTEHCSLSGEFCLMEKRKVKRHERAWGRGGDLTF